MNRSRILAAVTLLAACVFSGCSANPPFQADRTITLVGPVAAGQVLVAQTSNGAISLHGSESPQCQVHALVQARGHSPEQAREIADQVEITLVPIGNQVTLQVVRPSDPLARHISIAYDGTVPSGAGVSLRTSNGAITVDEIAGPITARTSNGRIDVHGCPGKLDLHTSNGRVSCSDAASEMRVETSNGSIEVRCAPDAPADLQAELTTSNGPIRFTLPADFKGRLRASTSNGAITADVPILVHGRLKDNYIEGTIGQGRGEVSLRTSNGAIRVDQ